MSKQLAIRLSLIAFCVTSLDGVLCGSDSLSTLKSALVTMAGFFVMGLALGELARRLIEEHVREQIDQFLAEHSEPHS